MVFETTRHKHKEITVNAAICEWYAKYIRDQVFSLLGCYTVHVGSCLLGQPISAIFKGTDNICHETSAKMCQQTLRNTPDEWRPHLRCGKTLNLAHVEITSSLQIGNIIAQYILCYLTQASADILTQWGNKMYNTGGILKIGTSHLITTSTEASLSKMVRVVESILSYSSSGPFINTIPTYAWRNWGQPVCLTGDSRYWRQHYCCTLTQPVLPTVFKRSIYKCVMVQRTNYFEQLPFLEEQPNLYF
jgi:hypothetical protein